jgi:hypothetical protein
MKKLSVLVVIVLLGAGVLGYWRAQQSVTVGEDFAKLSPTEQKQRRADTAKLQDQISELATAAKRKEHKPFTLNITEEQLNTLLQDSLRAENTPLRDLRAGISPSELALQGRVLYKGVDTTVTMGGVVRADNGKLLYDINSLKIGMFPAPSSLKEKAEKQVAAQLNKYLSRAPGRISSVQLAEKKLTIEGVTD